MCFIFLGLSGIKGRLFFILFSNFKKEEKYNGEDKEKLTQFLSKFDLRYEEDIEYTIIYKQGNNIIATGSISGPVIKCTAINPDYQNRGLLNKLITDLIKYEYNLGNHHLFVFTKPIYIDKFKEQGFKEIETIKEKISMLEFGIEDISDYKDYLSKELDEKMINKDKITALVLNCNPYTKGHEYLIKRAAAESDFVVIFVVEEDKSLFPADIRYKLVKQAAADFNNVEVVRGGNYIISSATFPSYFTQQQEIASVHAELDLNIFAKHIAPVAGINWRYVGEEPYCKVTSLYNEKMKKILGKAGIQVKEIKRKKLEGKAISASHVRELIKNDKLKESKRYLPSVTYDFLKTDQGKEIIERIRNADLSRH